jgi:hypothetical protein
VVGNASSLCASTLLASICTMACGSFGDSDDAARASGFGEPSDVAREQIGVHEITSDETAAYWLTEDPATGDGSVMRWAPSEALPRLLASEQYHARGLVVDGARVYWAVGSLGNGSTIIRSTSKLAGGLLEDAFVTGAGNEAYSALALDGTSLAWGSVEGNGSVVRGDTVSGGSFVVATDLGVIPSVALRAPFVYWAAGKALFRSDSALDTAAPALVLTLRTPATSIAVTKTASPPVLYACAEDGTVQSIAADGSGDRRTLAEGRASPRGIAIDDARVYWANTGTGTVETIERTGGAITVLAKGQEPLDVAATAEALFYADRARAAVVRIPRR